MKSNGIVFTSGLTAVEISKIEKIYGLKLPTELIKFYSIALPIANKKNPMNIFPMWNDFSDENIKNIKEQRALPKQRILEEYKNDGTLLADIGIAANLGISTIFEEGKYDETFPATEQLRHKKGLEQFLSNLETIIPIFSHRYMILKYEDDNAVISAYGTDIIAYGVTLKDYLINEFIDAKNLEDIYGRISEKVEKGEDEFRRLGKWRYLIIR